MELDYQKVYKNTMKHLMNKVEDNILFETMVFQLQEDNENLKALISEKDIEIAKLKQELEGKENEELLDSNN